MKASLYYFTHTFVNSIKKVFRSWVIFMILFIVICGVIGGVIGMTAAELEDSSDDTYIEETYDEGGADTASDGEDTAEEGMEQGETNEGEEDVYLDSETGDDAVEIIDYENSFDDFMSRHIMEIMSAVPFLIILITVLLNMYSADKNGSAIFNMADVNMLFTSPMKPQAILTFRMSMKMGLALVSTIYLLFQLPNLINWGVSIPVALWLMAAWAVNLVIGQIVSVATYTLISGGIKKHTELAKRIVIVIVLAILAHFIFLTRQLGGDFLYASVTMFGRPWMTYIPIIGWLTGFCVNIMTAEYAAAAIYMALTIGGCILLGIFIYKMPADFYEDALPGAEKNQYALETKSSGKSNVKLELKQNRFTAKIAEKFLEKRRNFEKGEGAQMFLLRNLHDRRYAYPFGLLTKTADTYLLLAAGVAVIHLLLVKDAAVSITIYGAIMLFIVLFRSFGNPLASEMGHDFIYLVPEPAAKKLLYSLLSGGVEALLNMLPSMVLFLILVRPNVGYALILLLILVSTDFFMTMTATLVALILPTGLSEIIRQWLQLLLVTVAILVIIIITAIGAIAGGFAGAAIAIVLSELIVGAIMFVPCPMILENGRK